MLDIKITGYTLQSVKSFLHQNKDKRLQGLAAVFL